MFGQPSASMLATTLHVAGEQGSTSVMVPAELSQLCQAVGIVLFLEGDQILDPDLLEQLGDLAQHTMHLQHMVHKFPGHAVAVVLPSRLHEGFACYDNFLAGTTATGEPMGYKPAIMKAAAHLRNVIAAVASAYGMEAQASSMPVHLIGFSKACVVLNQVLAELAAHEDLQHPQSPVQPAQRSASTPRPDITSGPSQASASSLAAGCVLDQLTTVHYLDAGLNCRGVYLTDPRSIHSLSHRHARQPLHIHLHGTPRQWGDKRRIWNYEEKERFKRLLSEHGMPVEERLYFEGQAPSLAMHFSIIGAMQV